MYYNTTTFSSQRQLSNPTFSVVKSTVVREGMPKPSQNLNWNLVAETRFSANNNLVLVRSGTNSVRLFEVN